MDFFLNKDIHFGSFVVLCFFLTEVELIYNINYIAFRCVAQWLVLFEGYASTAS